MTQSIQSPQHSLQWYRARLGKITGSRVGVIYGRGRGAEFSKTAFTYLHSVAAERMIPEEVVQSDELFSQYVAETDVTSRAMRIGSEREQEARTLYSIISGFDVEEAPSFDHPEIPGFSSSPDGIVRDSGGDVAGALEIKCPSPHVYMEYLTKVQTPSDLRTYNPEYFWQCVAHIMVTGALWCDFAVYNPFNREPLHVIRINAEDEYISALRPRIETALEYIDTLLAPFLVGETVKA